MATIDVEKLLSEISAEAPCGEDLEYDPGFSELERAAQGKPEQEIGDTKIEAQPPDWREVEGAALELFARTKDLRVAALLAKAALHTGGFGAMSDGLQVVRGLLERYWDQVHPQLDPDDNNDPTMRVNALKDLADSSIFLPSLRVAPLVSARGMGEFNLRDIRVAKGERAATEGGGGGAPNLAAIDGAFAAAPLEEVQAVRDGAAGALEHLKAIDAAISEKTEAAQSLEFDDLIKLLTQIHKAVADQLAKREGDTPAESPADSPAASEAPAGDSQAPAQAAKTAPPPTGARQATSRAGGVGQIDSPQDVIKALEAICAYSETNEPSSPVPLLARRAKGLVSKGFMEIVRDLTPESVKQLDKICGNDSGT
jgi:type VI secretion system protein ImpA